MLAVVEIFHLYDAPMSCSISNKFCEVISPIPFLTDTNSAVMFSCAKAVKLSPLEVNTSKKSVLI